jgi:aryl-phospho-beta-D-glucosidase BglC (GH1 family)
MIVMTSPLHVEGKDIKDQFGNLIYLRGANKVEFADDPDGIWMGSSQWSDANVQQELGIMRSWGINTIRCHLAVENWKYNLSKPYANLDCRTAIKRLLTFAGRQGMYVVLDGYRVTNFWNGGEQDPLPYPPYQTSANASSVISSQQDFVNWWTSMATELKGYSNAIFELWNEPYGNSIAKQSWFNVAQECVNAVRSTGATQLIVFQWDMACWVDLSYPPPAGSASTMDWVEQANLSDPLGNIVYSTHLYRTYNHITYSSPTRVQVWNYSDIDLGLQYMGYYAVAAAHPLFIGEIGANYAASDLSNELAFFNNALSLFNQHNISYTAFWWREIGLWPLYNGPPSFSPNQAGQILETLLKGA